MAGSSSDPALPPSPGDQIKDLLKALEEERAARERAERENEALKKEKDGISLARAADADSQLKVIMSLRGEAARAKLKAREAAEALALSEKGRRESGKQASRAQAELARAREGMAALKAGSEKLKAGNRRLREGNSRLRERNARLEEGKKILEADRDKLLRSNRNYDALIRSQLAYMRDNREILSRMVAVDGIPADDAGFGELKVYSDRLMENLASAAAAFAFHQARSLNLGTAERNGGAQEAGARAEAEGREELSKAAEVSASDPDASDFEARSGEFEEPAPKGASSAEDALRAGLSSTAAEEGIMRSASAALRAGEEEADADRKRIGREYGRRKEAGYSSTGPSQSEVAGIIVPGRAIRARCPFCGRMAGLRLRKSPARINEIYSGAAGTGPVRRIMAPVVLARCSLCGEERPVNPASLTEFSFERAPAGGAAGAPAGTCPEQGPEQGPERVRDAAGSGKSPADQGSGAGRGANGKGAGTAAERRGEYDRILSGGGAAEEISLEGMLVPSVPGGEPDVIDPCAFNAAAEAFGNMPAFIKSSFSIGLLASGSTINSQLGVPKNRLFCMYSGLGLEVSRAQFTCAINAFARAFLHAVCERIRRGILMNCSAVLMDESTLNVRETAERKSREGKGRKSQIWTLNSCRTSPIKATWITVRDSRGAGNVADILADAGRDLKFVVSDGYSGYDSGLWILRERFGVTLKSARCWTHARRPLHRLLDGMRLLGIYNKVLVPGGRFSEFPRRLREFRKTEEGSRLSDLSCRLLWIYCLINSLFAIDGAVARRHRYRCQTPEFKADLLRARRERSVPVVNAIFDSIRLCILAHREIMDMRVGADGRLRLRAVKRYPQSKALVYLLRFEKELREFTASADVELSQSTAERSLKLGICARKSFMFLQSVDGGHAFADFQTIANTCAENGVPVQPYLLWLCANIKLRMARMQAEGRDDPTFFAMPGKRAIVNEDGSKAVLDMYDPRNKWSWDKVSVKGLAPYEYRALLDRLGGAS